MVEGEIVASYEVAPGVLVIDGLDRIRDIRRARELFVESDALARLACRVVICGPFALRHHPTASAVPRFLFQPLVNEPVLDQHDPTKPGPGLRFFTELYRCRTEDPMLHPVHGHHLSACHRAEELPPAEALDSAPTAPTAARRLALYAERRAGAGA